MKQATIVHTMAGASESPLADEPAGCPSAARMRAGLTDAEIIWLMESEAESEAESADTHELCVYNVWLSRSGDVTDDSEEFDWWFGDGAVEEHTDGETNHRLNVAISARSCARAWAELARRSALYRQEIRDACKVAHAYDLRVGVECDVPYALTLGPRRCVRFIMSKTVAQISAEPLVKAVSRART